MSQADVSRMNDLLGLVLGWPQPPDRVPLRLLGLSEKPASQDAIRAAFRAEVKLVHPDLSALPTLLAQTPEVQELVWARDVLLRKVPPAVTHSGNSAWNTASRHVPPVCFECGGKRLDGTGKPYRVFEKYARWRRRKLWVGLCLACAADARNAAKREHHRQIREMIRGCRGTGCQSCGASFTPERIDTRYCSPACRQKAYRKRRAAKSA